MTEIASFDVFDTVLTRAVGSPEALFLLLGRRLYRQGVIGCTPEAYARARIAAEQRAHKNRGSACTLAHIYEELGSVLLPASDQRHSALEAECGLEAELIRPVPGARARIDRARRQNQRIVFVSDMYLPAAFIQEQLARHGMWAAGDRCYVSCECGGSKASGRLFAELLQREATRPQVVTHHGNNPEHDIRAAQQAGMQGIPLLTANLNRYEELLETHKWATAGLTSVMAGASRLARMSVPAANPREAGLRDVAAGVAAPTLTGFVLWLLAQARRLRLERLYFLSRDGQVLLEIARRLAPRLGVQCELCYLYGSRQAWNLPALSDKLEEELFWIWDTTDFLSVRSWLARLRIAPEEVIESLSAVGLQPQHWTRRMTDDEQAALRRLLDDSAVRALIRRRAAENRGILLKYLRQEGVLDGARWGMVDLGWYGSMHNAMCALVTAEGGPEPAGFYFGVYNSSAPDHYAAYREAYFFDERRNLGFVRLMPGVIALMEMFCSADHGTVVDFAEEAGRIGPVLKAAANRPALAWGLPTVRAAIYAFADRLLLTDDLVDPTNDVREALAAVLHAFWMFPLAAEARAWAAFPWEDGLGTETYWNRLAEKYDWADVIQAAMSGRLALRHRASWQAGSLALSNRPLRAVLKATMHARAGFDGVLAGRAAKHNFKPR
jgi:FMN phosphatase YigB (HAD superfamily)